VTGIEAISLAFPPCRNAIFILKASEARDQIAGTRFPPQNRKIVPLKAVGAVSAWTLPKKPGKIPHMSNTHRSKLTRLSGAIREHLNRRRENGEPAHPMKFRPSVIPSKNAPSITVDYAEIFFRGATRQGRSDQD